MFLIEMFDGNKYRVALYKQSSDRTITDFLGMKVTLRANFIFDLKTLTAKKQRYEYSIEEFSKLLSSFDSSPIVSVDTLKEIYANV